MVSRELVKWYSVNKRDLPWRNTSDPYIIWLSEIILQQTRVEQGTPYFQQFTKNFPTVKHLAKAPQQEVLKLWQGLGYYSRARNLYAAAKVIVNEHHGKFPGNYDDILRLPGIGEYTAAAITSFAYNQPYAVVDGNVYRFLSRYFGIYTPIDSTAGKKEFKTVATEILDKKNPGTHNQAMMEFGATVCKPAPLCEVCPLQRSCFAFREKVIKELPVKSKKTAVKNRYFNYLLIRHKNHLYLNKRVQNDIWKNLYEFPLIETANDVDVKVLMKTKEWKNIMGKSTCKVTAVSEPVIHKLSHQKIFTRFIDLTLQGNTKLYVQNEIICIAKEEAGRYPVPRLIEKFMEENLD